MDLLKQVSVETTLQKMDQVLEKIFSNRILSFGRPVIEAFLDKYQPLEPEANQRFRQVLAMAEPRLPINLADPHYDVNVTQKSFRLVGFMSEQTPAGEKFRTSLSLNQVATNEYVNLNRNDRMIVVREFGVFPLRIIQGMQNYRFHYQRGIQQNKPLHIDKRVQFTDFMPPSFQDMERLQLIFFPCLALDFLGDYTQTNLKFEYWSQSALRMQPAMISGNWDQCMETINADSDLRCSLEAELQRIEQNLTQAELGNRATAQNPQSTGVVAFIDRFQQYVAGLSDGYNNRYREKLIGRGEDIGILEKYRRKLERIVNERAANSTPTISGNNTQNILSSSVSEDQVVNAEVVNDVENTNYEPSPENINARQRRREEIKQCKEDLEQGVIDQEEYDREVEAIKQKYRV